MMNGYIYIIFSDFLKCDCEYMLISIHGDLSSCSWILGSEDCGRNYKNIKRRDRPQGLTRKMMGSISQIVKNTNLNLFFGKYERICQT